MGPITPLITTQEPPSMPQTSWTLNPQFCLEVACERPKPDDGGGADVVGNFTQVRRLTSHSQYPQATKVESLILNPRKMTLHPKP